MFLISSVYLEEMYEDSHLFPLLRNLPDPERAHLPANHPSVSSVAPSSGLNAGSGKAFCHCQKERRSFHPFFERRLIVSAHLPLPHSTPRLHTTSSSPSPLPSLPRLPDRPLFPFLISRSLVLAPRADDMRGRLR